jgi:carbon monoxide dehydrogenase subunit G
MATVGQKGHAIGKIAGRKMEIFSEVSELVPNKRLVISQRPGGLFKTFSSTVSMEPSAKGTRVAQKVQYEASMGYLGKALGTIVVNRTVNKNAKSFLVNVKELAELRELPKQQ